MRPQLRASHIIWWVDRLSRGGQVLAPGEPSDPIQLIDARDPGRWTILLLERSITGIFHAGSPAPPFGFGRMLGAIAVEVAPPGTHLTWVDTEFLISQWVDGSALPLWLGGSGEAPNLYTADPAAAYAAGLAPRPLRETVADLCADGDRPRPGIGLPANREADLLARWAR